MSTSTPKDGTTLYYKDWGTGPAVTFSHGWPLSSDAWDGQLLFLAQHASAWWRTIGVAMADRVKPRQATTWMAMPTTSRR